MNSESVDLGWVGTKKVIINLVLYNKLRKITGDFSNYGKQGRVKYAQHRIRVKHI